MNDESEFSIVAVESRPTAVVKLQIPMTQIRDAQHESRAKIDAALKTIDVGAHGACFTLTRPPAGGEIYMEPGTIVSRAFDPIGDVVASSLPAGRAARYLMKGGYENLPNAYPKLIAWCGQQNLKLAGVFWEIYGAESDPAKMETPIYALLA